MGLGCCGGGDVLGMGHLRGMGLYDEQAWPNQFGLGQDDDDEYTQDLLASSGDTASTPTSTLTMLPTPPLVTDLTIVSNPSSGSSTSSSSSNPALTNAESNLATAWTKVAGNVIAPQTTITTPQGLQISTPASQTSNVSSLLSGASSLSSASLSSLLPWILIGGAAWLLVGAMGKK